MSEWISVKDRLPELLQSVVLVDVNRFESCPVDRHIYDAGYLNDSGGVQYWAVRGQRANTMGAYTHWMPLPAPPVSP